MIDIRQQIINQLKALYADIPRYGEEVPQGFEEPSFYVKLITGKQNKEFNTRYKKVQSFDIHYFGKTNKECESMATELYEKMEYLSNMVRGVNMNHKTVDRVLHFFIDYPVYLIKNTGENPKMNTLEVDELAK